MNVPRLLTQFQKSADGCWNWTGEVNDYGYGRACVGAGKRKPAHRIIYQILVGPIPNGLTLDHLCRNRLCVNPEHLEPVTLGENLRRGFSASSMNARKTECPRCEGPLTPYGSKGWRRCEPCTKEVDRRWRESRKEQSIASKTT